MKTIILVLAAACSMDARTCLAITAHTNLGDEVTPLEIVIHPVKGIAIESRKIFVVPRDPVCLDEGKYLVQVFGRGFLRANRVINVYGREPIILEILLVVELNLDRRETRCEFLPAKTRGASSGEDGLNKMKVIALDIDLPVLDIAGDMRGKFVANLDARATYIVVLFTGSRIVGSTIVSPREDCRKVITIEPMSVSRVLRE